MILIRYHSLSGMDEKVSGIVYNGAVEKGIVLLFNLLHETCNNLYLKHDTHYYYIAINIK